MPWIPVVTTAKRDVADLIGVRRVRHDDDRSERDMTLRRADRPAPSAPRARRCTTLRDLDLGAVETICDEGAAPWSIHRGARGLCNTEIVEDSVVRPFDVILFLAPCDLHPRRVYVRRALALGWWDILGQRVRHNLGDDDIGAVEDRFDQAAEISHGILAWRSVWRLGIPKLGIQKSAIARLKRRGIPARRADIVGPWLRERNARKPVLQDRQAGGWPKHVRQKQIDAVRHIGAGGGIRRGGSALGVFYRRECQSDRRVDLGQRIEPVEALALVRVQGGIAAEFAPFAVSEVKRVEGRQRLVREAVLLKSVQHD